MEIAIWSQILREANGVKEVIKRNKAVAAHTSSNTCHIFAPQYQHQLHVPDIFFSEETYRLVLQGRRQLQQYFRFPAII